MSTSCDSLTSSLSLSLGCLQPFVARFLIGLNELDVTDAEGAGKMEERYHRRISPATFETADILLREAGGLRETLLGEAFFPSQPFEISGPQVCAYPFAQLASLHTMRFISYNVYPRWRWQLRFKCD